MALAGGVLHQQHLARADGAALAVAGRDLHGAVEVDDVLAAGCGMPVEVVVGGRLAEDDAGRRQPRGELGEVALLDPGHLDVAEMRFTLGVGIEIVNTHAAPPGHLGTRVQWEQGISARRGACQDARRQAAASSMATSPQPSMTPLRAWRPVSQFMPIRLPVMTIWPAASACRARPSPAAASAGRRWDRRSCPRCAPCRRPAGGRAAP